MHKQCGHDTREISNSRVVAGETMGEKHGSIITMPATQQWTPSIPLRMLMRPLYRQRLRGLYLHMLRSRGWSRVRTG